MGRRYLRLPGMPPPPPRPTQAAPAGPPKPLSREEAKRLVSNDWHVALPGEPPCGKDEWRTKDRMVVLPIRDMADQHLMHAIRFATEKRAHRWKHRELVAEWERRVREEGRQPF